MKTLDIKLHNRCNNKCLLCCIDEDKKQEKEAIPLDDVLMFVISHFKKDENIKVVLTGGEPTLYHDIINLIIEIKSIGCQTILLQTNGAFLDGYAKLEDFINAGVNMFGISLHGYTAEIHDCFTQTKGSFDNTVLTLRKLRDYNANVLINSVINKININCLSDIMHLIEDNELAYILQFAYPHITGKARDNKNMIIPISVAAKQIKKCIMERRKRQLTIRSEAIPCCLLRGNENIVSELFISDDEIIVLNNSGTLEFSNARKNFLKSKGPKCMKCLFGSICEGPWKEYPQLFGWDEFVPIKDFMYK
jgi:MoaA/NifB/PqqE/SkfB family radical SAM enzyme